MAKKTKAVPKEKQTPPEPASVPEPKSNKPASRRTPAAAKKAKSTAKKSGSASPRATKPRAVVRGVSALSPTDEDIRLRAYFVSERRHRLGLPGDASSDWLEAKRQLLSETGPR